MKRIASFLMFLAVLSGCAPAPSATKKGALLIVGGRAKPAEALKAFIDHVGAEGRILVIPSASGVPLETGPEGAQLFRDHGAKHVDWLFIDSPEMANADSVVKAIDKASGVFFTGGVQSRLMTRIGGTASEAALHRLYEDRGGVIGGTSAGAAVQSAVMITGDGDWKVIRKDSVKTTAGFGFLKTAIVDQHFVKRQRNNRLLTLAIETGLPCIGIDESTAIFVHPDESFTVYGIGSVLVYDPRPAHCFVPETGGALAAEGIALSVLRDGQSFDLDKGKLSKNEGEE